MAGYNKPDNRAWRGVPAALLGASLAALVICCLSGCGDFFESKSTELESKNLLRDLETVKITPGKDTPIPDAYREPPKIIETTLGERKDARLFYFTRYHTVDKLAALVNAQFLKQFMGEKSKTYPVADYNVATSPATNQLIVRCPSVADAQEVLKFLQRVDVPPIQVKIDCLISEVYADHTLDWETNLQVQNLFGENVDLTGYLPGAALRDALRKSFGLDAGYEKQDAAAGHKLKALVDLLVSRGYLKILMNPQLEVINGQTAKIITNEHVRLDEVVEESAEGLRRRTTTRYIDVEDMLEITPRVFADGFIGIQTRALIMSKATPEGVTQTPVITTREVNVAENRIRPGESLVIGGIRKTEQRSVVRGVPFLKDVPVIGVLFSSKDFEERGKEVMFILTPTISTGGIPNEEMIAEIQRKHTPARSRTLTQTLSDPLGSGMYTELVEEEATKAEVRRVKAEMQRSNAERKAQALEERLAAATAEAEAQRAKAAEAEALAKTARTELDQERAKTAAAAADKEKVAAEAQKLAEAAKAAQAEAEKAKAKADAAKTEADKANKEAQAEVGKLNELQDAKRNGQAPPDQTPSDKKTPPQESGEKPAPAPAAPQPDAKPEPQQPTPPPEKEGPAPAPKAEKADPDELLK